MAAVVVSAPAPPRKRPDERRAFHPGNMPDSQAFKKGHGEARAPRPAACLGSCVAGTRLKAEGVRHACHRHRALIFAFALAGCGEEQSATNSKGPPGPAETATLPQPDPNRPAEPARPPEAGGGGAVTQGPGSQPDSIRNAPARSLDTTNLTGALPPPGGGRDTGAELQAMMDRTYSAGQVSIRFDRDNNFTMRDTATGREVKGPFAYMDGVVTFLEPQSADTGVARFPCAAAWSAGMARASPWPIRKAAAACSAT